MPLRAAITRRADASTLGSESTGESESKDRLTRRRTRRAYVSTRTQRPKIERAVIQPLIRPRLLPTWNRGPF
jgi:hypothetical protein